MTKTKEMLDSFTKKWGQKFDYSDTKYKKGEKVSIICRIHGRFSIDRPCRHLSFKFGGCHECFQENRATNNRERSISNEIFIERCVNAHTGKYDYSETKYRTAHDFVTIICPEHGRFIQLAQSHQSGSGCRKCAAITTKQKTIWSQDDFLKRAVEVHSSRFDYSEAVYQGSHVRLNIICKVHNCKFTQLAYIHISGQNGCPYCNNRSGSCDRWLDSLSNPNIIREYQIKGTKLRLDGYDPCSNTAYQFHGDYWHGNPNRFSSEDLHKQSGKTFGELHTQTLIQDDRIINLGYNLVVMREYDWKKNQIPINALRSSARS